MKNIIRSLICASVLMFALTPNNADAHSYRNTCAYHNFRMNNPGYCGVYVDRGPSVVEGIGGAVGGLLGGIGEGIGAILSIPFGGRTYYNDGYYYDNYRHRRHHHRHW
ncbi:MAG: hypothetical protein Q8L85_04485 [Alphaproteobacteria bacterium]|nr:hypothetical protein [Alphaproteobacteria bacterium]